LGLIFCEFERVEVFQRILTRLQYVFKSGSGFESYRFTGLNFNFLSGLGVAAGPGFAGPHGEGSKPRVSETLVFFNGFSDYVEGCIQDVIGQPFT